MGCSPDEVRKIPNQCSQDSDATPTKPTTAILLIETNSMDSTYVLVYIDGLHQATTEHYNHKT